MEAIFLDTSFLIALEASDDQNHDRAVDCWQQHTPELPDLVTTRWILDETATFFNTHGNHRKAVEIGERMQRSAVMNMLPVGDELFSAGWELFTKYQDKRFSLTDCVSFAVMHKSGIVKAFTFDTHFRQMGFQTIPSTSNR